MPLDVRLTIFEIISILITYEAPRSICQLTSWAPLQISEQMLQAIVAQHDIESSFWQIPLSFSNRYKESLDLEQAFCVPYNEFRSESCSGK